MASGKQVSFQFGEVSPALRFKSDAVSYSAGLSKLKNMYVRKAGGVSNRPGTTLIKAHALQTYLTPEGGDPLIKAFNYWDAASLSWKTLEYAKKDSNKYAFYLEGVEIYFPAPPPGGSPEYISSPSPSEMRFTYLRDRIFTSPESVVTDGLNVGIKNILIKGNQIAEILPSIGLFSQITPIPTVTCIIPPVSPAPIVTFPVSYLITANMSDGSEKYVIAETSNAVAPFKYIYPVGGFGNIITLSFTSAPANVRSFNLYRATGRKGFPSSFYKLAAKVPYDGTGLSVEISDFGAEDVSITPPLDNSAFQGSSFFILPLRYVDSAAYYQQRLIGAISAQATASSITTYQQGVMIASKLGCPEQVSAPTTYTNTGAFQFNIPTTDGTKLLAMLSLDRLIVFSERAVYVVLGGDQGVLTPGSVNPILVSEEGCSRFVEPKSSGRMGYFINSGHTKLMGIEFGDDGNIKRIIDASLFSSHFLYEDVVQMEIIRNVEDSVFILRRDGKLIQVSIAPGDEGVYGFSLLETSGYIESIYRAKEKKPYRKTSSALDEVYQDVLMMYVIRNGTRYLERLDIREDVIRPSINFSDCTFAFGYALSFAGSDGYKRIALRDNNFPTVEFQKINIQPSASWDAGTVISIRSSNLIPSTYYSGGPYVIDFFYDENGIEKRLRYAINLSSQTATGDVNWPWQYTGTFDIEVPESLRNVNGISNISTSEKNKRWTRWIPATNGIPMFGQVIELWYAGGGSSSNLKVPICMVADGQLLSSPLNPDKPTFYIEKYFFTPEEIEENELPPGAYEYRLPFPDYYNYGFIGLPYESDFETLDLEASDNRTMTDSRKLLNSVGIALHETRGGFFGIENAELENMAPLSPTSYSPYNEHEETDNFNGHIAIPIPTNWSERGRVRVRQVDPLPMTILSVYPKGIAGD